MREGQYNDEQDKEELHNILGYLNKHSNIEASLSKYSEEVKHSGPHKDGTH